MHDPKGLANFKSWFFYALNGKSNSIKIVPLNKIAVKDDFLIS